MSAVAARRWKAQINLNAKAPAFCAALPDLAHDELAGWGQGGDVTRQVVTLVLLRHDGEDAESVRMFDVVTQMTDEVMAGIIEVRRRGTTTWPVSWTLSCSATWCRSTWPSVRASIRVRCRRSMTPSVGPGRPEGDR